MNTAVTSHHYLVFLVLVPLSVQSLEVKAVVCQQFLFSQEEDMVYHWMMFHVLLCLMVPPQGFHSHPDWAWVQWLELQTQGLYPNNIIVNCAFNKEMMS